MADDISDLPAPPQDISDLPAPPTSTAAPEDVTQPKQSVIGALQAATSGIIPGALASPGMIADLPHKAIELAKIPFGLAADALTAAPEGFYKVGMKDGSIQIVPKGQQPGSYGSYTGHSRPSFLDPSNEDPDQIVHWLTAQAKSLIGADYVEEHEKTPLNHYINQFSQGATQALTTGTVTRPLATAAAGGSAALAQQGVADLGGGPVPQTLVAVLAGHTAGHVADVASEPSPSRTVAQAKNTPVPPSGAYTPESLLAEGATKRGEIAAPVASAATQRPSITKVAPDKLTGVVTPALNDNQSGSTASPEDTAGILAGLKDLQSKGKLTPTAGSAPDTGGLAESIDEDVSEKPVFETVAPGKSGLTTGNGPFSILSAERGERTPEENAMHTTTLENQLKAIGLPHEATQGVYQGGAPEKGFAVQTDSPEAKAIVETLAKMHDQESVLHVDENQNGAFKYTTGEQTGQEEPMGKFQMVPQAEAEGAVGFTRDTRGNHYILKSTPNAATPIEQAATVGAQSPPPTTAQQRGASPPAAMSFRRPPEEGQQSGELGMSEQMAREQILRSLPGLEEVRRSAITGDTGAVGSNFQTSKLNNAYGKRMASVINNERIAVKSGADDLVAKSGGTDGLENADLYNRGSTIGRAPDMFDDYLNKAIQQNYTEATARLGGKPIPALTETQNYLKANKSNFLGTVEGKQLLEGVNARMKELGFVGDNDTFNPPSVEQAERMRQYLGEQWTPRTGRLVSALKDSLDNDVAKAAGEDVYAKARTLNSMRDQLLRSPKLVSSMLTPADGLNRTVPVENIPKTVTGAPVDQFGHLVNVLKEMGSTDPTLAHAAADSLNEIRSQFMNEYRAAGNSTEGMWNAKAGSKYLENNNMKMASVFSPQEMQGIKNHNDAAAILKMDRSYPGASAQHHNFLVGGALKGVEHLGGIAGAALGEIPGAVAGLGAQKVAGKIDDALMRRKVEQQIVNLLAPTATGQTKSENDVIKEARHIEEKFKDDVTGVTPPSLVAPTNGQEQGQ